MGESTPRASWKDLSDVEKKILEGHVGPDWLPQWFCNKMAGLFKTIYRIAVQERHDFCYLVGGDADSRFRCDRKLLEMMRADCRRFSGEEYRLACFVTDLIYLTVRLFGWLSFKWRERPLALAEARCELERKHRQFEEGREAKWKWLVLLLTLVPLLLFSFGSYLIFKLLPLLTTPRRRATTSPEAES